MNNAFLLKSYYVNFTVITKCNGHLRIKTFFKHYNPKSYKFFFVFVFFFHKKNHIPCPLGGAPKALFFILMTRTALLATEREMSQLTAK